MDMAQVPDSGVPKKEGSSLEAGAAREAKSASQGTGEIAKKLGDYALENPGKALSISVLTFGGLLLLVYFVRIGFLPDITLESATTLLYATAMLGLFMLVVCATYLVLPGLASLALWHDYKQQGRLTVEWAVGLSSVAAALAWAFSLSCVVLMDKVPDWVSLVCLAGCALAATGVAYLMARDKSPTTEALSSALMVLLSTTGLWALLFTVLLLTVNIGKDGALQKDGWGAYAALIVPLLFSALLPLLFVRIGFGRALRVAILVGPAMLLLLLVVTESFSKPSAIVVSKLGAGEYEAARLVLTGKGCRQLNLALGDTHCTEVKDEEPTALCPVALRSRIGGQVLIEVAPMALVGSKLQWVNSTAGASPENLRRRVVLDKSALLAWSPALPLAAVAASAPGASEPASLVYRRIMSAKSAPTLGDADTKAPDADSPLSKALVDLCGKEKIPAEKEKEKEKTPPPAPAPKPRPQPKPQACCCAPVPVAAANTASVASASCLPASAAGV